MYKYILVVFLMYVEVFTMVNAVDISNDLGGNGIVKIAKIVLPQNSGITDQYAAKELCYYLKQAATSVTVNGKPAEFHVGFTAVVNDHGLHKEKLADEEWVIKALPDGKVILCGGGNRGTLYSVCVFLERQIGIRWFTPTEEYIPVAKAIDLTGINLRGRPFFRIRNVYRAPKPKHDQGRFAMHHRLNQDGEWPLIAEKYGSGISFGSPTHCHSIENGYMPANKYFIDHPEYFSLINGKRNCSMYFGQICLSNPILPGLFTKKLKKYILDDEDKALKAGQIPPKIYDISLNDSRGFCECSKCAEKVAEYGESGTLLLLLNHIASELKKFRPDYYLQTLGYFSTTEPPKGGIKPLDNIIIRTCNTQTVLHEKIEAPCNRKFQKQVENWAAYANMLFPWEYSITYGSAGRLPYPSEFTIADNLRFYAKNKGIGVFFEHESPEFNDMYDLKVYLEAKLLENPNQDVEKLKMDFCTLYYGNGAPALLTYRQELRKAAFANHAKVDYFFPSAQDFRFIGWKEMKKMQQILDVGAEKIKSDPTLLQRFNRARASLDFALIGTLAWFYRVEADHANETAIFEKMHKLSRQRFFNTLDKSIKTLTEIEKRTYGKTQYEMWRKWRNFAEVPMKIRHNQFKGKHRFFAPDCWFNVSSKGTFISDPAASAGACYRITSGLNNAKKIRLTLGTFSSSTQKGTEHVIKEIELNKIIEKFTWVPIGKVNLKYDNLILTVVNRTILNWRFEYLQDLALGDEAEFWVELRYNKGTTTLDVGAVVVCFPKP